VGIAGCCLPPDRRPPTKDVQVKPANKRKRRGDQNEEAIRGKTEMAGFFHSDDKTLRKHIKKYVNAIAALKEEKSCLG
jgi:hypothetical protein